MNNMARRVEALEQSAGTARDSVFASWELPENVGGVVCEGHKVERQKGEDLCLFMARAENVLARLCGPGIHWLDGIA